MGPASGPEAPWAGAPGAPPAMGWVAQGVPKWQRERGKGNPSGGPPPVAEKNKTKRGKGKENFGSKKGVTGVPRDGPQRGAGKGRWFFRGPKGKNPREKTGGKTPLTGGKGERRKKGKPFFGTPNPGGGKRRERGKREETGNAFIREGKSRPQRSGVNLAARAPRQ